MDRTGLLLTRARTIRIDRCTYTGGTTKIKTKQKLKKKKKTEGGGGGEEEEEEEHDRHTVFSLCLAVPYVGTSNVSKNSTERHMYSVFAWLYHMSAQVMSVRTPLRGIWHSVFGWLYVGTSHV